MFLRMCDHSFGGVAQFCFPEYIKLNYIQKVLLHLENVNRDYFF